MSLIDYLHGDINAVGSKRGFDIWPGCIKYSVIYLIQFMQCFDALGSDPLAYCV